MACSQTATAVKIHYSTASSSPLSRRVSNAKRSGATTRGIARSCCSCKFIVAAEMRKPAERKLEKRSVEIRDSPSAYSVPSVLYSNAAIGLLAGVQLTEGTENSYYAALGLFVLSVPGLWSTVKRSTKSKIVQRTFVVDGPDKEGSEPLDQLARRISEFFKNNNYRVVDAGEVITFKGLYAASKGTAAYISFCVFIGMIATALVGSIAKPEFGNAWYGLTLLGPASGYYYYSKAGREEEVKVKMVTSDDNLTTEVTLQGDAEEVERFRKTLDVMEKDMIYVKGIFET